MLRKQKTAVVPKRNLLGRLVRGRLPLSLTLGISKPELLDLLDMGYLLPKVEGGTSATNTVLANPVYFPRALVVSTDQTINQGDLVFWDGVNYTLKPLVDPTDVLWVAGGSHGFAGAAQGSNVPNVFPNPPAGTPSENLPGVVVQRGGSVKLNSTTGEGTYFPFEPVTVGADAQTISRAQQTTANRVGFVIVPPPVNARSGPGATPAPETAAAGSPVEVWLETKFPDTALL